jgi:hypothetical protein
MKRFLVLVSILMIGCEKKIDFTLHDQPDKLVVEGIVENDQAPLVILTKSIGYFSTVSVDVLNQSFVHGANVFVSNGLLTHQLKEYARPVGNGVSFYYYTTDSSNLATAFKGELDHSYSLKIVSEGKEYMAVTTIPNTTKKIDSVWWIKPPVASGSDTNKVLIMVRATDPAGYGDYVRYYTKTNKEPFYPPLNSTFDDFFIDGTTYELQIDKGVDRNLGLGYDEIYFKRGDTVGLKLSNIDKGTYDFWRTMEFSYSSVGDPFSTPTKVLGNIKGDALGYFGGYASQFRTIIIPH